MSPGSHAEMSSRLFDSWRFLVFLPWKARFLWLFTLFLRNRRRSSVNHGMLGSKSFNRGHSEGLLVPLHTTLTTSDATSHAACFRFLSASLIFSFDFDFELFVQVVVNMS